MTRPSCSAVSVVTSASWGVRISTVAAATGLRARSWTTATTSPLLGRAAPSPASDEIVPAIVTRPAPKPTTVWSFVIGWRRIAPIRDGAERVAGAAGAAGTGTDGVSCGSSAASSFTGRLYGDSPRCGDLTTLGCVGAGVGFRAGSWIFAGAAAAVTRAFFTAGAAGGIGGAGGSVATGGAIATG